MFVKKNKLVIYLTYQPRVVAGDPCYQPIGTLYDDGVAVFLQISEEMKVFSHYPLYPNLEEVKLKFGSLGVYGYKKFMAFRDFLYKLNRVEVLHSHEEGKYE